MYYFLKKKKKPDSVSYTHIKAKPDERGGKRRWRMRKFVRLEEFLLL